MISSSLGGVTCVTASASTHGASASDGSVAMAIFWNEGQGGNYSCATTGLNLSSNSAGLFVVTRPDQKILRISASHPTKLGTSLELMITGVQATGSACSPGSAPGSTRVIVDLPGTSQPFMTGAPITVECAV
jgi:hypothetical protein